MPPPSSALSASTPGMRANTHAQVCVPPQVCVPSHTSMRTHTRQRQYAYKHTRTTDKRLACARHVQTVTHAQVGLCLHTLPHNATPSGCARAHFVNGYACKHTRTVCEHQACVYSRPVTCAHTHTGMRVHTRTGMRADTHVALTPESQRVCVCARGCVCVCVCACV